MATKPKAKPEKDAEKSVDLPPYGSRNPDPITDSPGSHPIETGIGAVIGGAASGMAVGAVGGPVGAVIGAAVGGAVAGGLAGKGVGELIDPTTEDNWIREYLEWQQPGKDANWEAAAREAYRFGMRSERQYAGRPFDQVEGILRPDWETLHPNLAWAEYRRAVHDGYDRARTWRGG
jgi:hypothetical protein